MFHFWEVYTGLMRRLAVIKSNFSHANSAGSREGQSAVLAAAAQHPGLCLEQGPGAARGPACPKGANSVRTLTGAKERNSQSREAFPGTGRQRAGFDRGEALAARPGAAGSRAGRGARRPLPYGPTTHLPGSGTWRLPLLSMTSRGGRGCPAPTSTAWKLGVLKDMGGHGSGSIPRGAQPQAGY